LTRNGCESHFLTAISLQPNPARPGAYPCVFVYLSVRCPFHQQAVSAVCVPVAVTAPCCLVLCCIAFHCPLLVCMGCSPLLARPSPVCFRPYLSCVCCCSFPLMVRIRVCVNAFHSWASWCRFHLFRNGCRQPGRQPGSRAGRQALHRLHHERMGAVGRGGDGRTDSYGPQPHSPLDLINQ